MNVDRRMLVAGIECVFPAIGTNALLPVFHNVKVTGDKVEGTDGSIKIETWMRQDIGMNFCVNAGGFLGLLSSLSCEEIELRVEEGKLLINTTKLEGEFKLVEEADFPDIVLSEALVELKDGPGLNEALTLCKIGVSTDETSGVLCGVIFDGSAEETNTFLYSCDRFRILRAKWKSPFASKFSVPIKFVDILQKRMEDVINIDYMNDRFQVVLCDGTRMSTLVHAGEFQPLGDFFPGPDVPFVELGFGDEFKTIFERHIEFLKGMDMVDKEVVITTKNKICTLKSHAHQLGLLEEQVEIESDVEIELRINPMFLQNILTRVSSFRYYSDKGLVMFQTDNMEYLVQTRS